PTVSEDFLPEWRDFLNQSQWMDFERWLTLLGKENGQPMIYADESAALIRKLHYTAHHAHNKVVIMWLPERMNTECANKLLKMIEEPFDDTILLFVSNDASAVLPTIYSRTQRIEMRRYPDELLANYLHYVYSIEPADAMAIAHVAEGNVNAAVRNLGATKDSGRYLELFITLMRLAYKRKVKELRDWSVDVADLGREKEIRFLEYCQRLIRENFIYNIHVPALNYMTRDESAFSANFARFITERNVEKLIAELNRALADIAANGNAKIILFDLAIKVILLLKQ
ncbi:MAG: DNA polymerase III subunit delta, partial [Muribaculaceae bacterium]|nr:DNA polymerase III subunit delta [Muribaculaceae bacterium]